jgi:predicted metal-dependent phosphoesterase TrpH
VNSLATDHLRRLEALLATARADYDTLAYIMLEGMDEIAVYSRTRQVSLPVGGEDIGHIQAILGEAALHRITALEQEIAQTHALIAQEAAEDAREQAELAAYRRQARAVGTPPTRRKRGTQFVT